MRIKARETRKFAKIFQAFLFIFDFVFGKKKNSFFSIKILR